MPEKLKLNDDELDKVTGGVTTVIKNGNNCYWFKHGDVYSNGSVSVQIWNTQYIPVDSDTKVHIRAYVPGKNGDRPKVVDFPPNHPIFNDCYYYGKVDIKSPITK